MSTSIVWPTTLPQLVEQDGFQETPPNTTLVSTMDVGPKKIRRRSTKGVRAFAVRMYMTQTQRDTFDAFYETTTKSGSLSFMFPRPGSEVSTEMWFKAGDTPSYGSPEAGNIYVSFNLEMLG